MRVSILKMLGYAEIYFKAVSAADSQTSFFTITSARLLCLNN